MLPQDGTREALSRGQRSLSQLHCIYIFLFRNKSLITTTKCQRFKIMFIFLQILFQNICNKIVFK